MVILTLDNRRISITGGTRKLIRELENVTSYTVAGHVFVKAFQRGWWDGKEHLLTYSTKHGYRAPIGLLEDIVRRLAELKAKVRIEDNRVIHGGRRSLPWNDDIIPRPYQREAVRAGLKDVAGKPWFGQGIYRMPIRSGKTKTAAVHIQLLGVRTLFTVPSQMLLHQTVESLTECFPGEPIGIIGDGECDIQYITVATIQTLQRWRNRKVKKGKREVSQPDPRYTKLITETDLVVVDEAHHLRGNSEWYKVVDDMDCRFRLALSATVLLDNTAEQERGIIWLKATIGGIRIDIPEGRLIREGWLLTQNIRLYRVKKPELWNLGWSQTLRRRGITDNQWRNQKIATVADAMARKLKVLIIANRLDHIANLSQLLWDHNREHEIITGGDGKMSRQEKLEEFAKGKTNVLLGTVLSEGIDIPEAECVINAEGGRDPKNTIQRMRNMTISEGKTTALLIDFIDETNPYLLAHSQARLEVYRSIEEFTVEVVG